MDEHKARMNTNSLSRQQEETYHTSRLMTQDDPSSSGGNPLSSTRALSRKNRVFVFREFLIETYGEYLSNGSPTSVVLDVAGGRGTLSWLLINVDGYNSVVADPRLTKEVHLLRLVDFLRQNPLEAERRAVPGLPTFQPLAKLMPQIKDKKTFFRPRHLRTLVDQDLVNAVTEYQRTQSLGDWKRFWSTASAKTALCGDDEASDTTSANQITDPVFALQTILNIRLILGFHPDQATEAAVDLALVLSVPFCIVPCCVFPAEFAWRKNADGTRLRTYHQLLEYLVRKSPDIRHVDLNFPFTETSKNRALYTLPHSCSM